MQAIGIHRDDNIVAVNGIPLSSVSLSDWIEASTSKYAEAAATAASAPPHLPPHARSRTATFPVLGVPKTLRRPVSFSVSSSQPENCQSAEPAECAALSKPTEDETHAVEGEDLGLTLTGFLRVEVVSLAEAEITIRPGKARRIELVQQREEAAEAERKEKGRLVAEEKLSLEETIEVKGEDKERSGEETMSKAMDAEQKIAVDKQLETKILEREEEATVKAVKKSRVDIAKLRTEGKSFIFTAEYKIVAPMGLTFDLANPRAIVSEVVVDGSSEAAGVRVGDHLVRVNDRDTSEMKPTMAIKFLQRAEWPRVLTLLTPEKKKESGGDQPLLFDLVVTEPTIARGAYLIQAPGEWGYLGEKQRLELGTGSCEFSPMVLADPASACQQDLRLSVEKEGGGGDPLAIVLVKRGLCTFVEKAKNVQFAIQRSSERWAIVQAKSSSRDPTMVRGDEIAITTHAAAAPIVPENTSNNGTGGNRGGMVLLNGEDALADMPAGNLLTDDIRIPVAMVSQRNGSSLETLLSWGVDTRATIAPVGACPFQAIFGGSGRARKQEDNGGLFLVHSKGAGGAEFDYRQAQYGPGIIEVAGTAPYGMTVADPLDGCDDKPYKVRITGMLVAVKRGGCSFNMKTLVAQRLRAKGVIIINTAETTLRVMADPGEVEKALLPTVMVSAKAGRFLILAAGDDHSPMLGRFVRKSYDAERG
ncbi:unnamed protein product [Ascophyllum nodosum]